MDKGTVHILLVEDEGAHAELVRRAFESSGDRFRLTVANNLEQARALLSESLPDLIIADWLLPDGRGTELLPGEGRAHPFPVVMMTSYGGEQVAVEAMKAGAFDYVVKSAMVLSDMPRVAERALREWGHIVERERLEEQLRQSQKMEAVGRLAGGIAHDFNNLLTAIIGYTDLLISRFAAGDPIRADLEEVGKAAGRAAALTRQLLAFSRRQTLQPRVLNLNSVIAGMERMLRRLVGDEIDLLIELDPDVGNVRADPVQIERVIMNLVVNASDAMPGGGKLTIETANVELGRAYLRHQVDLQPGLYVMLAVRDTGIGMDEETLSHLFEPFFTTKGIGKGTGLGLATAYGIVRQSGGNIRAASELGRGSSFRVYLPRIMETAELQRPGLSPTRLPQGSETVLLVEDEDMVRELARRVLLRCGYTVLEANRPSDAVRICERQGAAIDLLITDVAMPGTMSGHDLARYLVTLHSEMRVLYISGYTDDAISHQGVLNPGVAFLQKPFTPLALARKVRQVLDAPL
jgi:signal transduction histidine kinase